MAASVFALLERPSLAPLRQAPARAAGMPVLLRRMIGRFETELETFVTSVEKFAALKVKESVKEDPDGEAASSEQNRSQLRVIEGMIRAIEKTDSFDGPVTHLFPRLTARFYGAQPAALANLRELYALAALFMGENDDVSGIELIPPPRKSKHVETDRPRRVRRVHKQHV